MNSFRRSLAMLICLSMLGCHGGAETDLLERELRLQEDYIYELQDEIAQYELQLNSCYQKHGFDRRTLKHVDDDGASNSAPASTNQDELQESLPDIDKIRPPIIEPGIPIEPDGDSLPPPASDEASDAPSLDLHPPGRDAVKSNNEVERIVLSAEHRSGHDASEQDIVALLQLTNSQGDVVRILGEVSLMVVRPSRRGTQDRVARWNFSAAEADACWRKTDQGESMQFELSWPGDPPQQGPLDLWARFMTPEGRKWLTKVDFEVPTEHQTSPYAKRSDARTDRFTARSAKKRSKASGWNRRKIEVSQSRIPTRRLSPPARPPSRLASRPLKNKGKSSPPRKLRPEWRPYR